MKKLLIIVCTALVFSSCKKEKTDPSSPMQGVDEPSARLMNAPKTIDESLDKAALIIATSLKEPAVRSFIKTEALKQFDGDYDILYQQVKNNAIKGRSLESIFSANAQEKSSQANNFQSIVAAIPAFQISVPVHCEKWNDANYTPLVAIAQPGVKEKDIKQFKAYDSDGNVHYLDAQTTPDKPVIMVGISERVDANGKLKYSFEKTNNMTMRTNGQNTILGTMMCPDLSRVESWANGRPELRLQVFGSKLTRGSSTPTATTITTKYYNPKRDDIDGVWYTVNTPLFNWYYTWTTTTSFVYGSDTKFAWIEEDGGNPVNISLNIGGTIGSSSGSNIAVGLKTSFTIEDKDENLGDANVYFTDGTTNHPYPTGDTFTFELD